MTEEMKKDYANINATYGTQGQSTNWDYHLQVAEELQTEASDDQLYFIIRHPWRYPHSLVEEAELLIESTMGIGAADFIRELTDEEVCIGGT